MGQGQELHARKMMSDCMAAGGWVLLQNVHLSLTFCSEIIDILVETEHIDDSFRLWVTTEVHEEFPIGLLQMAIKFTNEPPQGIRASLKRSYQVNSSPFWRIQILSIRRQNTMKRAMCMKRTLILIPSPKMKICKCLSAYTQCVRDYQMENIEKFLSLSFCFGMEIMCSVFSVQ